MTDRKPVVYIFHGDDEFAIGQTLTEIESQMGDPSTAAMNTTTLDGRNLNLDELIQATRAMPFLAERRLVVLTDPLGSLKSSTDRDKFKSILENTPESTALVIQITKPLVGMSVEENVMTGALFGSAGRSGKVKAAREKAHAAFGHAVGAAEVAPVRHGDPKIGDPAIKGIYVRYHLPSGLDLAL